MPGTTVKQINSTNQIIRNDISDELTLINANVSPVVSHILKGRRKTKTTSTTIEWIDNYVRRMSTTLVDDISDTDTTLKAAHAETLVVNALLAIGDEVVKVTAVTADTATVIRNYAGTTATAHVAKTDIKNMGIEMEEGGELVSSTVKLPVSIENKTGILYEEFEVTETAKHLDVKGQNGLSSYQIESAKKKEEMMSTLENKILNSVMYSNGKSRNNAGAKQLIKKHGIVVDGGGVEITKEFFDTVAKQISEAGGRADLAAGKYFIVANWDQVNKIDNFNRDFIRASQDEKTTGTKITQVITTGGILNVFHADSLNSNEMLVINLNELELKELYPVKEEIGAKTKLATKYFMHGESSVKLGKCPMQVYIHNIKA